MLFASRSIVENLERRRPLSLILAEDNAVRRPRLRAMLTCLGARIQDASDGWEVMSLLLSTGEPIDLVISDMRLLRGSGLDALASARAAGIAVPFLFLGAATTPQVHASAARLGAMVLDEPVVARDVVAGVWQLCRHHAAPRGLVPGVAS